MKPEDDPRWVTVYDEYGDLSGLLAGSPEGLKHLRDTIDRALTDGEARTSDDISFFFAAVKVETSRPEKKKERIGDFFAKAGFLSIVVVVLILLGLGVFKLGEVIMR